MRPGYRQEQASFLFVCLFVWLVDDFVFCFFLLFFTLFVGNRHHIGIHYRKLQIRMTTDKKRVVVVGLGMVGIAFMYVLLRFPRPL